MNENGSQSRQIQAQPELYARSEKSSQPSEFERLMSLAGAGDDEAIKVLVDRYGKHVKRAVRRILPHRLRSLYDSDDFGQAVWKSFLVDRVAMAEINDPAHLIAYLATLARNKVIDESRRRLGTQKHNLRREQRITWDSALAPIDGQQPSPSAVAIAGEALERLSESASSTTRQILALRLEGRTSREIAAETGINERSVRRALAQLAASISD